MSGFRLAVAQSPGELTGKTARLDWLGKALDKVAKNGADLVLLPELFSCGYNLGNRLIDKVEPSDGETATSLAQLANEFGIAIHYGYAELSDGKIYNAAQCIGPDGFVLGHHRKLAIPPGFERDIFVAGQGCQLFSYRGFKIATLICYDAEFPETFRHVAALGADLVLVPTALGEKWGWVANKMIPTRAFENGVFLAYSNSAGIENGLHFLGESFIATPDGREIARAGRDPEIVYANLDRGLVAKAQARLPYLVDRQKLRLT